MRFADYGKRVVFAAFDGGEIMASAGVLLLREQTRRPACTSLPRCSIRHNRWLQTC